MQVHIHHHAKARVADRKLSAAFTPSQRRIARAVPQVVHTPIVAAHVEEPQAFSPLIQEFLDECGYSDK